MMMTFLNSNIGRSCTCMAAWCWRIWDRWWLRLAKILITYMDKDTMYLSITANKDRNTTEKKERERAITILSWVSSWTSSARNLFSRSSTLYQRLFMGDLTIVSSFMDALPSYLACFLLLGSTQKRRERFFFSLPSLLVHVLFGKSFATF